MTPEGDVKQWIKRKVLDKYGDLVWGYTTHQGPYGQKGVPDLIFCIMGLFVAIEVKTEVGTLTKLQSLTLKKIEKARGIAVEIRGKDQKALDELFENIDEVMSMLYD